jgi:hypothetical protein
MAANQVWAGRSLHTRSEIGDRRTDADDLAAIFVALDHGIGIGERVFAIIHVDVRAADADAVDLQQELIGLELAGWGNVAENDVIRFC